ncbi:prepilin-type N-terminal cleavage/methylation domain-containing protein [Cohnella sp. OV330]|uniref:type IV pilus modification PilV family protein n=1 Tax=Cohnella sp. OV330 TaxID=1855288 RepID=UPI0008F36C31|nr:type II secretion system protein [Cohnella sp. OV330]SFA94717.1 prepilin-type N-terminal cleavage/methylation domain-containing protein [Cohnella sp. OV330]
MGTWLRKRRSAEEGFSLIEVLAAITILSIVSLAMTAFFIQAMSYAKGNQNKTVAVNLARNALFFVEKQSFETMKGYFLDKNLLAEDGTVTFNPAACTVNGPSRPVCTTQMNDLLQQVPTLWDVLTPVVNGNRYFASITYDPSIFSDDKKELAPYLIPVRISVVDAADPADKRSASEVEGYIANEKIR